MAEEQREIPQETGIPFNDDVSSSPTKETEPTAFYLFGTRIPFQDSSSLAPKETTRCSSENQNEEASLPLRSNTNANPEVTCDDKEQTEEARKTKKMRSERTGGVSSQQPPDTWTIKKTLSPSDVGQQCRLMLEKSHAESHILPHLSAEKQRQVQDGVGVSLTVYDHDTDTDHNLTLNRMAKTTRSYVLNGDWMKDFVRRRDLKQGYEVGLFCNVDSELVFSVLSPVPAGQTNPN